MVHARCLSAPRAGIALVPSLAARARSRETSLFAPPLRSSGDLRSGHRAARATRCERGWGRSRFTTRPPLRRPCERHARAFFSPVRDRHDRLWHPCRLLRARGADRLRDGRAVARRPPRPVPRGPCERRALSRSEVPSVAGCAARPARTEMRTNLRCLARGRGAHVMRIAEPRPIAPLSPGARPCAHARGACLWLSPRSRAPCSEQAFDPLSTGGALLWARRRYNDFCKPCDARALTASVSIPRMRQ